MQCWIDRLLRRPGVTPEGVAGMRRVPMPPARPPADEGELASKRRLRARMADNLPNLPQGPLRSTTINCIEHLDEDIRALERKP